MSPLRLIGKWKYQKPKFVYEKDVLFKQTNAMGNMYFSNYVELHGETREKFFLEHPAARAFLIANPQNILVTSCIHHDFLESSYFGDKLRVEMTSRNIQKYSVHLVFNFFNALNEKKVGEGWQKVCFIDSNKKKVIPIPQILLDLLQPISEKK